MSCNSRFPLFSLWFTHVLKYISGLNKCLIGACKLGYRNKIYFQIILVLLGFRLVSAQSNSNSSKAFGWQLFKAVSGSQKPETITTTWEKVTGRFIREGYTPPTTWLKAQFVNPNTDTTTFYWVITNPYIDSVDFWVNNKLIYKTGISVPFDQRPSVSEYFVLPFSVAPKQITTIHTRLGIRGGSLTTELLLLNSTEFDAWYRQKQQSNLIYLFLIFNVLIIAVIVSLVSNRRVMIFYAMYLGCFIFFQIQTLGYGYRYLWPNYPFMAFLGKGIFQLIASFSFLIFTYELNRFSNIKDLITVKFFKYLFWLLPIAIAIALIFDLIGYYQLMTYFMLFCCFTFLFLGILDLIKCVALKYKPAYGVLAAVCFPFTAAFVIFLYSSNLIPHWPIIEYAYQLSFLLEFSLILVFTIYFMRRQNRFHIVREIRFRYHQNYLQRLVPESIVPASNEEMQQVLSEQVSIQQRYQFEQMELDFNQLRALLEGQKLFCNPDLSLQFLAKQVGIPFAKASRCVNAVLGKNFSEWVNEYRVIEAKRLLKGEESTKFTIEAIGQMAGFGSRSSFYAVFKRNVGVLPSEFKEL